MIPADVYLWRLSAGSEQNLGLCCTEEGLFLGRTPLIERHDRGYAVRPQSDLERLFKRLPAGADLDRLMPGLAVVKSALDEGNLCLAQIAAVHLRVPDLPDLPARTGLETEDRLVKAERGADMLARGGWDPDAHPREGVPPNPGWFAPTGGPSSAGSVQIAQGEEERAPEEMLDPLAPARQAQWDAAIARLREIDPNNPDLTYVANPGAAPSQAALARLNAAVEAAAIKRVTDKVMPGGVPIGQRGRGYNVRVLTGGAKAATELFDYLRAGGAVYSSDANITIVQLPGTSSFITYRPISTSGPPAIDINIPGMRFMRLHFAEGTK